MKNIRAMQVILFAQVLWACCSDVTDTPSPDTNNFEVKWRTPIVSNPGSDFAIAMNPVMYEEIVVFNTDYPFDGHQAPVLFLDTAHGTIVDYWSDYSDGPFSYTGDNVAYKDEFLFLSGHRSVDCINMKTRKTQWQGSIADNGPFIYTYKGFLYRGIEYDGQNPLNNRAAVMRTPVDQMAWDTVFAFSRTDRYKPGFDSMGFGILPNGDEVVVWKNRSLAGSKNRTDIFAFNLTADTLLWRNMDFYEASGIVPLKIDGTIVFGLLEHHAIAIDLLTGQVLWTQNFNTIQPSLPQNFFDGDLHLEGKSMLIKGPSDELITLNKLNGQIESVVQDLPYGMEDSFTYFEGKLFFSSSGLIVIDAQTGQPLVQPENVQHLGDVVSKIVIDEDRRVMYMHNGQEALCVKIPEGL